MSGAPGRVYCVAGASPPLRSATPQAPTVGTGASRTAVGPAPWRPGGHARRGHRGELVDHRPATLPRHGPERQRGALGASRPDPPQGPDQGGRGRIAGPCGHLARRLGQSEWAPLTFYRVEPEGPTFHMPSSSSVGRPSNRRTRRPATAQPTPLPCVLLVDDNADNREMYRQYLEWDGFRVVMATDGVQALDQAARVMPTVIVTDLAMPKLNGWDMVGRLKGDPRTRHVPVLAVSAHALVGEAKRALAVGCDGYVSKPCLPEELARAIRTLIQRQSATPSRSAPVGRPARRPILP